MNTLKYWKSRCLAAEEHIYNLCIHPKRKINTITWIQWQKLKKQEIKTPSGKYYKAKMYLR